ncbi:MAG: cytochrome P450 [Roseiflexaceae bacterium]
MSKSLAELPAVRFSGDDIMAGRFPALQARMALEHGPIYKWVIDAGPDAGEYVFMVGPEANRFVMHTGREHFSHDLGWTPIIGDSLGKGLLNMDDPEHARHRKLWNPAFTSAYMETYLPVIQRVIAERTRRWPEQDVVDVYTEAREITFDAAAVALAGFRSGAQVDRLRELFYTLLHGFDASQGGWEDFMQRMLRARDELGSMLLALIADRRRTPEEQQPRDVVGMIVRARDEQGQALSDEQLLAHVNILLVAGHETTTTLGSWVLYLLATQPEQRRRVQAELELLLGDSAEPIPVAAIRSMKTLDNFIKETGRLYPPVINVPRGVVKDFEFAGYRIPAGTPVRLALAASHRLPHVFANPETFDPDRFAPPREEDKRTPYALVTFGGGPRICIGMNFANIEVKALAAHTLRRYVIEPAADHAPVHAGHWTAALPGGMWMRARTRS